MFSGIALNVINAQFYLKDKNSDQWEMRNYFQLLGRREPKRGPRRNIKNRSNLKRIVDRVCARFTSTHDIKVFARVAKRKGWRILNDGKKDACSR